MRVKTPLIVLTVISVACLFPLYVTGQLSTEEIPAGIRKNINLSAIEPLIIQPDSLHDDYAKEKETLPMFAGISLPVAKRFSDIATRSIMGDGSSVFHVIIEVPGAHTLGIVFSDFHILEDDKFFVYSLDKKHALGAFTSGHYSVPGYFSTHILPTQTLVLEYHSINFQKKGLPGFFIDEIMHILYPPVNSDNDSEKSSGACNVNINCPEGEGWQKQKRGIVRILLRSGSNSWFNCTGSLINNTAQDGHPYLLTADHCGATASAEDKQVWQFYFNYERPDCNNSDPAPNNLMLIGANLIANSAIQLGTDFKLLELIQEPPLNWNPYFNGWSLSGRAPEWGVCIHHPSGDAKKISHFLDPAISSTFTGGMPQGYWQIVWSETESGHGVTEGGSSGSPIFDTYGLIRGTLTGGGASCNNPTLPDYYGKFDRHWIANGESPAKQLQPWLDPLDENPEMLFGFDPNRITNFVIATSEPLLAGSVQGGGYFAENEPISLFAEANEGFIFLNWTDANDQIISTDNPLQFVMPQNEVELFANFTVFSAIYHLESQPVISIFPNPVIDYLHIHTENKQPIETISIYSTSGQLIEQNFPETSNDNTIYTVYTGNIPPGIYYIQLSSSSHTIVKKVILTRKGL